jgi:hypothetical protein
MPKLNSGDSLQYTPHIIKNCTVILQLQHTSDFQSGCYFDTDHARTNTQATVLKQIFSKQKNRPQME